MLISISHEVKAANSALAKFLRSKEEEEATLGIGKRKPKALEIEKRRMPSGRGRWTLEPDFTVPTPMVDRPRTESGATSFHFSFIPISKRAVPVLNGKPLEGFHATPNAGHRHSQYIERDGAAEMQTGARHAVYVEREGAVEQRPFSDDALTDEEAAIMGPVQAARGGVPSIFSNISDDPFERQEYWRAVERFENEPRKHFLFFEPDVNPRWWRALETTERLPAHVKAHALSVAQAYRVWLDAGEPAEGEKEPFVPQPLEVTAEEAGVIINRIQSMKHYSPQHEPFNFRSGRGGRIQYRFVAELPYDIMAEDRALIVQNFCRVLESLEARALPTGENVTVGMMYTAVIHAPDASNDRRNYHLHLIAHDRPAKFLEEFGMWDFEVTETRVSHRKEWETHPFHQKKIRRVNNRTFIPFLRKRFAEITNAVLAERGVARRYDPRKYPEMGIDRTPTEHLGTKAAALEAIGVPTIVGQLNAIAIWNDAERSIRVRMKQTEKDYRERHAELEKLVGEVAPSLPPEDWVLGNAKQAIAKRAADVASAVQGREAIMIFDHLEAKAKSRAVRTRETCLRLLAEIEAGRADVTTRIMKDAIQARWKAASDHIATIDRALAPHREALRQAGREIERLEKSLRNSDANIREDVEVLTRRAAGLARSKPQKPPEIPTATHGPSRSDAGARILFERTAPATATPAIPDHEQTAPSEIIGDLDELTPSPEPEQPAVLAPVSIDGFPIIEPTIAPAPRDPKPDVAAVTTPKGLEPLRPAVKTKAPAHQPEVINEDISRIKPDVPDQAPSSSAASTQRDGAGRAPAHSAGEQNQDQGSPTITSTEPNTGEVIDAMTVQSEPKVDGHLKIEDPKPLNDPEQLPPVKRGTSVEYADWNELVNRIAKERIPVQVIDGKGGTTIYKLPALTPEEQNLLHTKRFHGKTIKRLAGIAQHQRQEIDKIVRWINSCGQNSELLILEGRVAKLGNVKPSTRTLLGHWGRHPDVAQALQNESTRRIELADQLAAEKAREAAKPKASAAPPRDADWAARKAEAERVYPTPENVYTLEVKEFTKLLRELAPAEDLQAAADRIMTSPAAREDVQRHTHELAVAFKLYDEGLEPQILAGWERNKSGAGRG